MSNMTTPDEVVAERIGTVRSAIDELGRPDVTIVAVTKGFDRSAMDCAQRLGLTNVGENYAQELVGKTEALNNGTNVHFMGRIQRNKVRKVVEIVDSWHSVARPEILTEIAKRATAAGRTPQILIQVRPHDDVSKDGVRPNELDQMLETAREAKIAVAGLMTIGVLGDSAATNAAFIELAALSDEYGLAHCSMGMSGDYRDALAAGSTILRLGSALFGDRPARG